MNIKNLHAWDLSPKDAIALQKQLATQLKIQKPAQPLRFIAGVDCAFSKDGECIAGVVVWDKLDKKIIETQINVQQCNLPYIPGLLSFREAPSILEALSKIQHPIDAIMVDGQGYAHPRRLGIASHIGLFVDIPTMGCGKSRLVGTYIEPGMKAGDRTALFDRDELIGTILRTRNQVKSLFVSPGNNIDFPSAEKLVLDCCIGYRLPEPTRQADKLVAKYKIENYR